MTNRRHVAVIVLALFVCLGMVQAVLSGALGQSGGRRDKPEFQVDATWPKPLPNRWILGSVIGVAIDSRDHVWILHRPGSITAAEKRATEKPPTSECCVPAPPVIEFDPAGNVVQSWGGPGAGYEWPKSEHGLFIDHKDNLWIGGNVKGDAQVLKFARNGKFLLQIGHQNQSGGDTDLNNLGCPADTEVDPQTNEVYVADGYCNHRVIVFDADTGAYKRHWGAYGKKPDGKPSPAFDPLGPPSPVFGNVSVHCVRIAKDGLVYVCDRANHRIQVFKKDGSFVKEVFLGKAPGVGNSVWDIDFSPDGAQRYLYNADGGNMKVWMLSRGPLEILGTLGQGGRQPGNFFGPHNLVVDTKGNLYVGETFEGKRVQKFLLKGAQGRS